MINNKTVVAIIPARGGSKRLPGKNIKNLDGKPLIAWSIDAAINSIYIDHVIVTTDDVEIANVAIKYGAMVPFIRAENLSTDIATTEDVINDCLEKLVDIKADIIVVLQPTSPFRSSEDIDSSLFQLCDKNADGIVSVSVCEHPIFWSNVLPDDGNMGQFIKEEYRGKRSQDLPLAYRLNGAIYAFTVDKINVSGMSLSESVYSYIMPTERSVDIDTEFDFKFAEFLIKYKE